MTIHEVEIKASLQQDRVVVTGLSIHYLFLNYEQY